MGASVGAPTREPEGAPTAPEGAPEEASAGALREHLWEHLQEAEPGLRSESLPVGPRTRAGVALSAPSSAACHGRESQGRGAWSRRGTGRMKACVQITGKNGSG